jgi:hypothetical protein
MAGVAVFLVAVWRAADRGKALRLSQLFCRNERTSNMKNSITTRIYRCGVLTGALAAALVGAAEDPHASHARHADAAPSNLVEKVRAITRPYADVNLAVAAGYKPAFGCVSGPDHGAMGIHYINGALVGDGQIDVSKPEALIYEPTEDGLELVGVEYIVDASTWLSKNGAPPMLEGQAFQLVGNPNRYGLPAFFELHVWAWRHNPNGSFVDWNDRVTCEGR